MTDVRRLSYLEFSREGLVRKHYQVGAAFYVYPALCSECYQRPAVAEQVYDCVHESSGRRERRVFRFGLCSPCIKGAVESYKHDRFGNHPRRTRYFSHRVEWTTTKVIA